MTESSDLPFLPFSRPSLSAEAIAEVVDCLESGWITTGPRTARFEAALADYLGAPHVACLSSATAGLHLALAALDLQPGDEVITTPLTFAASLNTIVHAGGRPVLADIDPATLNIDLDAVEKAVGPKTRAIMPVHFAGLPVDLDPLYEMALSRGIRVIEDAAHAIGAGYRGRRIGSFGDSQVFSFHPNKNMTTGEGGAVATTDQALAQRIARLRFHGIDREAFNRFTKAGSQEYDVVAPGFKFNMLDMQAALGLHQLPALDGFNARRKELAMRYRACLAGWPQLRLQAVPDYPHDHAWHLFVVVLEPERAGMDRAAFMAAMKARNIGTGLHYQAAHLFAYYRELLGTGPGSFPHAEDAGANIVSLPLFPAMTEAEQDRVVEAMDDIFARGAQ
ncbi:DegT/DnrJ/EryC1/StrS family aminotransferase [Marinibaculum pumilum]|uniref:DegT/DnrJ/EryC1/StrS family aminotransferase n=1 Tax=Marinibaculum pumilum TaxID=1766165 RepID=A0ABV7L2H3_9PROT